MHHAACEPRLDLSLAGDRAIRRTAHGKPRASGPVRVRSCGLVECGRDRQRAHAPAPAQPRTAGACGCSRALRVRSGGRNQATAGALRDHKLGGYTFLHSPIAIGPQTRPSRKQPGGWLQPPAVSVRFASPGNSPPCTSPLIFPVADGT